MREALRYVHLVAIIVWIGGGSLFAFWGGRARRSAQPSLATFTAETIAWLIDRVLLPAMLVAIASGLALVAAGEIAMPPPAWLIAKVALVVVGVVLFFGVQRPTARALVNALHASGKKAGAQVPVLARRQMRMGLLGGLLALAIIGLAVFQP